MESARKIGPVSIREQVVKRRATGKWILDIPASLTSTGKRKRCLYRNRSIAEKIARQLSRELEMRRLGYVKAAPRLGLPFDACASAWQRELNMQVESLELRASSLKAITIRLKPLVAFFGDVDVANVSADEISRYRRARLQMGRKTTTINGEARVLRQLLGWCQHKGHIENVPRVKRLREPTPAWEPPREEDVVRLIGHLHPRWRVLVWLMAETGLRPGEAINLPWQHVNADEGYIRITAYGGWEPKTAQSHRTVWPSRELMVELCSLARDSVYVFRGKDKTMPVRNVRSVLASAARAAGVSFRPTPKLFRRAFASWQAMRGLHPRVLQELMGHVPGTVVTDRHYIFVNRSASRDYGLSLPVAPTTPALSGNASNKQSAIGLSPPVLSTSFLTEEGMERVKGIEPSS